MQIPRRLLPSISLLHAFEAVARTGSVTTAARELDLTQSAVSRQVKALEEQLEVELFVREKQTLTLTLAGDAYARSIRDALRRVSIAALNVRANPQGGTLNLAVTPTFGPRWLAPRLAAFAAAHPDVKVNLATREDVDFAVESFDAAIRFGVPPFPGVEHALIRGETVLPVCSPALKKRMRFRRPVDVLGAPLLILITRPDAWERWLEFCGAPPKGVHGMMFDEFESIIRAAVAGAGLGLVPRFLIEDELKSGTLVPVLSRPQASAGSYCLAWPRDRADYPPLEVFRNWLATAAA